jgi:hypothetical protein
MTDGTDGSDEASGDDGEDGDEQLRATVEAFLDDVDRAYDEYDQGYADADATLRVLRAHVEDLRTSLDD